MSFLVGERPTLESLVRHASTFGLDRDKKDYRSGKYEENTYTTYNQLSSDSLVEVGLISLTEHEYVDLIGKIGFPQFEDEARQHWQDRFGVGKHEESPYSVTCHRCGKVWGSEVPLEITSEEWTQRHICNNGNRKDDDDDRAKSGDIKPGRRFERPGSR